MVEQSLKIVMYISLAGPKSAQKLEYAWVEMQVEWMVIKDSATSNALLYYMESKFVGPLRDV